MSAVNGPTESKADSTGPKEVTPPTSTSFPSLLSPVQPVSALSLPVTGPPLVHTAGATSDTKAAQPRPVLKLDAVLRSLPKFAGKEAETSEEMRVEKFLMRVDFHLQMCGVPEHQRLLFLHFLTEGPANDWVLVNAPKFEGKWSEFKQAMINSFSRDAVTHDRRPIYNRRIKSGESIIVFATALSSMMERLAAPMCDGEKAEIFFSNLDLPLRSHCIMQWQSVSSSKRTFQDAVTMAIELEKTLRRYNIVAASGPTNMDSVSSASASGTNSDSAASNINWQQ